MEPKNKQLSAAASADLASAAKSLHADQNPLNPGGYKTKEAENFREHDTYQNAVLGRRISDIETDGVPLEVSGDALARAKAGKPAQYNKRMRNPLVRKLTDKQRNLKK